MVVIGVNGKPQQSLFRKGRLDLQAENAGATLQTTS
jgi:hypothetical protein